MERGPSATNERSASLLPGSRRQSLRLRVALLVLLVLLPALALLLYMGNELRETRSAEVERNALRLARIAAVEEDRLIEGARQLLIALAQLPEVREAQPGCDAVLANLLTRLPQYTNIGAARPDGEVYCSGLNRGPANISDLGFFAEAVREKRFATSSYVPGHYSGKPSINLANPILDERGEVEAVMLASLDLAWVRELAEEIRLPETATLLLLGPDGILLASLPDVDLVVGERLPSPLLLEAIHGSRAGTLRTRQLGGVDRIYGYRGLRAGEQPLGLAVVVGIGAEDAFEPVDRVTVQSLLILAVLGLTSLGAAWWGGQILVLQPLRAMAATAERLRRGDLSARTGLPHGGGELGALARSLDEMATSLEDATAADAPAPTSSPPSPPAHRRRCGRWSSTRWRR